MSKKLKKHINTDDSFDTSLSLSSESATSTNGERYADFVDRLQPRRPGSQYPIGIFSNYDTLKELSRPLSLSLSFSEEDAIVASASPPAPPPTIMDLFESRTFVRAVAPMVRYSKLPF